MSVLEDLEFKDQLENMKPMDVMAKGCEFYNISLTDLMNRFEVYCGACTDDDGQMLQLDIYVGGHDNNKVQSFVLGHECKRRHEEGDLQ